MLSKKILIFALFIFTFFIANEMVFALEVSWPTIPGAPVLSGSSSIGDFTAYAYALFVAIGTLIAVIVLIVAGIDLIITHNIAKAKPRIIGSLIGILVLVVPYSLLGVINPKLREPGASILSCNESRVCINRYVHTTTRKFIVRNGKTEESTQIDEKNIEEMSLNSMPKINESTKTVTKNNNEEVTIENTKKQTITIKKFKGLQDVIGFSEENYTGKTTMIFKDSPNNDDLDADISADIFISGEEYKSFKIVTKTAQIYFYDGTNYDVATTTPLSTTNIGFNDLTKKTINSIDIVNPYNTNIDYIGLMFNDKEYKTKCATFFHDIPDVKNDVFLKKANGGSLKIFSRNKEYLAGSKIVLTLYNNTSCSDRSSSETNDLWRQNKKCEITLIGNNEDIPDPTIDMDEDAIASPACSKDKYLCKVTLKSTNTIAFPKKISEVCPNIGGVYSVEDLYSFKVDSSGVIVFLDSNNSCNVWELLRIGEGESDCNRVNSNGMNPDPNFRPEKFFVIPYGGNVVGDIAVRYRPACGASSGKDINYEPTTDLCNPGTPSTVSGTGPWTWTCSKEGLTVSCSTQKCTWVCSSWSECTNGTQTRTCTSSPAGCIAENPNPTSRLCDYGACGASNGKTMDDAPTTDLCNPGTPSAVSGTGPWTWTCKGKNGKDANCQANKKTNCVWSCGKWSDCLNGTQTRTCTSLPVAGCTNNPYPISQACTDKIDGACGASNGKTMDDAPTTDLCIKGKPSPVSGTNPWTWTCYGEYGGLDDACSAYKPIPKCGSRTITSFSQPSVLDLCEVGNPSAVIFYKNTNASEIYNSDFWTSGIHFFWNWTCDSGKDSVKCSLPSKNFPGCGWPNGTEAPTNQDLSKWPNLCRIGYASNFFQPTSGVANWSCNVPGASINCSTSEDRNGAKYSAKCGRAVSEIFPYELPNTSTWLCDNEGTPKMETSTQDEWWWKCVSKYGTSSIACSAKKK